MIHLRRGKPMPGTACVARNRARIDHRPRIEYNRTGKNIVNEMIPNNILPYSEMSAQPSCHQRDCLWKLMGADA